MVLIIPQKTRHKKRPEGVATAPPVQTVSVVSVSVIDGTGSLWTFSGPVTVADGEPCPQLRIFVDGEWMTGANLGAWSETEVTCDFETSDLAVGLAWEIVQTPAGIDFGPAALALPQSGTLTGSER